MLIGPGMASLAPSSGPDGARRRLP